MRESKDMENSTPTAAESPARHPADSHAWIRVQGAREHNLKNVSVDLPKRRLTVFTGVSGSGKSSLVFATIAAESQRLINETYSAFVQGFMPTMARPEVDLLDGLTTAIIVDQERMGANPRSTVGTATDANAMLRLLFSRLGQPHIGPLQRLLLQRAVGARVGYDHRRARRTHDRQPARRGGTPALRRDGDSRARGRQDRAAQLHRQRRHVPALRGHGVGQRHRPDAALRRHEVAQPGGDHRAWLRRQLVHPHLQRVGLPGPGQADPRLHRAGAGGLPLPRAGQGEGRQPQHHLHRADPAHPAVLPVQGCRRHAAAHPRLCGARGHLRALPRMRRHPAQRGRPLVEDPRHQHRRRLRDADRRPGQVGGWAGRAIGRAAAGQAEAYPRFVRGDWAGLPLPGPAGGHALRAARRSAPRWCATWAPR
jgi:energy-coupling factor transporter ATP-binding protein EcfA2